MFRPMTTAKPLTLHAETVHAEWIDYNGHMNVAYYVLAFDHASDQLLDHIGVGAAYAAEVNCSIFIAEAHVTYDQEVREGDRLRFTTQILDHDEKRVHYFHSMYHATDGFLAATNEIMALHVDMTARRVVPFPATAQERLAALMSAHNDLPRPPQAGRVIGIRKKADTKSPTVD